MNDKGIRAPFVLGAFICAGLALLGWLVADGVTRFRVLNRTVEVKGLSEREVPADIAIWPITFREADNDLSSLYSTIQRKNAAVIEFLARRGFEPGELFTAAPAVVDKQAQEYSGQETSRYRYAASSTITVYTGKVDLVRDSMQQLVELGKVGIAIVGDTYESRTQFLFNGLNEIDRKSVV